MIIDAQAFFLLCAQATRTRAVVLVSRDEFNDRMREEDAYLKQKQGIPLVYTPFADAGYQNFIPVNDSPFMNDGVEIVTLFEPAG